MLIVNLAKEYNKNMNISNSNSNSPDSPTQLDRCVVETTTATTALLFSSDIALVKTELIAADDIRHLIDGDEVSPNDKILLKKKFFI